MKKKVNIIISGGGTGGHIFPAISIADALKKAMPDCNLLFVGAKGKMEMEKVPSAGYEIVGLPVAGFQRRLTYKNITFFFKLASSMMKAKKIIRNFKPDVAVGVGGYASGPVLRAAASKKIPIVIQEQNSYPGVTNKILAKKSNAICVAYPNMERFFEKDKIVFTGNPIRKELLKDIDKKEGYDFFNLNPDYKTILVVGGSLGARNINVGVKDGLSLIADKPIQIIWQTGGYYYKDIKAEFENREPKNVIITDFIKRMDLAYAIADVVVSRAGAGTISELALLKKAVLLVPSPNVSEDHQTKNAMALVDKNAAVFVKDSETAEKLISTAVELIEDEKRVLELENNIEDFARPNADSDIANEIIKLINRK